MDQGFKHFTDILLKFISSYVSIHFGLIGFIMSFFFKQPAIDLEKHRDWLMPLLFILFLILPIGDVVIASVFTMARLKKLRN